MEKVLILLEDGGDCAAARELSLKLDTDILRAAPEGGTVLRFSALGLSLESGGLSVSCELSRLSRRLRPAELSREPLVRAARLKGAAVAADATVGLGDDAMLLAAAGFTVHGFERDPVIAALLRDGLRRAMDDPRIRDAAERIVLHEADSIAELPRLSPAPDIVYLDPMFPERTKSGLVKKKFQLLHLLEAPCSDESALLHAAEAAGPRRIVIKRPAKAPFLAGRKPSYSVPGSVVRYDCIVLNQKEEDKNEKSV